LYFFGLSRLFSAIFWLAEHSRTIAPIVILIITPIVTPIVTLLSPRHHPGSPLLQQTFAHQKEACRPRYFIE
jgi:hypothetical protein